MQISVDNRLRAAADLLPKSLCIADIGCDHGKLANYLVQQNIAQKVIATDISESCLNKAQKLSQNIGLQNKIVFRQGDGLTPLEPGEAQSAVITGMGGELIADILDHSPEIANSIDTFVLQPMRQVATLRKYLRNHGFRIVDERFVTAGAKEYQIIAAEHGQCDYSAALPPEALDEIGPVLFATKNKLAYERIERYQNYFKRSLYAYKNDIDRKNHIGKEPLAAEDLLEQSKNTLKRLQNKIEFFQIILDGFRADTGRYRR